MNFDIEVALLKEYVHYKMKIMTAVTTEYLIAEVEKLVIEPYSQWKIGVASNSDLNTDVHINVKLFYPENDIVVLET